MHLLDRGILTKKGWQKSWDFSARSDTKDHAIWTSEAMEASKKMHCTGGLEHQSLQLHVRKNQKFPLHQKNTRCTFTSICENSPTWNIWWEYWNLNVNSQAIVGERQDTKIRNPEPMLKDCTPPAALTLEKWQAVDQLVVENREQEQVDKPLKQLVSLKKDNYFVFTSFSPSQLWEDFLLNRSSCSCWTPLADLFLGKRLCTGHGNIDASPVSNEAGGILQIWSHRTDHNDLNPKGDLSSPKSITLHRHTYMWHIIISHLKKSFHVFFHAICFSVALNGGYWTSPEILQIRASFSRPWKPSTEFTSTPWSPVRMPRLLSIRRSNFTLVKPQTKTWDDRFYSNNTCI